VFAAMDGSLGAYLRQQMEAAGFVVFPKMFDLGFRQITSSTHPIRTADDFTGFKIRTPPSKIFVDLFQTLGAQPTSISFNELYTSLQTHVVDGQETPYSVIESSKFYEVQKYLSVTNHLWAGWWLLASPGAWNALPPDIQAIVRHNAEKYALLERRAVDVLNNALADKLQRQGLAFNVADAASIKAKLGDFYQRWRTTFGATAWSLLEATTGKLG
jgi:tripartite ATP-independent transporter DctP family solute receptor